MDEPVEVRLDFLLDEGNLAAARELLVREILQEDSPRLRWLLFEVSALAGSWAAAQAQAAALSLMDPSRATFFQTYGQLAELMTHRNSVWMGESPPGQTAATTAPWLLWERRAPLLAAVHRGDKVALREIRILDTAGTSNRAGSCVGRSFTNCYDRDARSTFGLEAVIGGEYQWLAWDEVERIQVAGARRKRRDLVWLPVLLTLRNRPRVPAFLPTRYPGTEDCREPSVLAGRESQFRSFGECELGTGTRVLKLAFEGGGNGSDVPFTTLQALELTTSVVIPSTS